MKLVLAWIGFFMIGFAVGSLQQTQAQVAPFDANVRELITDTKTNKTDQFTTVVRQTLAQLQETGKDYAPQFEKHDDVTPSERERNKIVDRAFRKTNDQMIRTNGVIVLGQTDHVDIPNSWPPNGRLVSPTKIVTNKNKVPFFTSTNSPLGMALDIKIRVKDTNDVVRFVGVADDDETLIFSSMSRDGGYKALKKCRFVIQPIKGVDLVIGHTSVGYDQNHFAYLALTVNTNLYDECDWMILMDSSEMEKYQAFDVNGLEYMDYNGHGKTYETVNNDLEPSLFVFEVDEHIHTVMFPENVFWIEPTMDDERKARLIRLPQGIVPVHGLGHDKNPLRIYVQNDLLFRQSIARQ